ncbi:MAG: molybdopterin-binding protein [Aliishimia sp.]
MKFGPVPVGQAVDAVLAHSMEAQHQPSEGTGVYRIAKGTKLTPAHIADLSLGGHVDVTVARFEDGDVEENTAATQLAHALVPNPEQLNLRIAKPGAGRVNLYATHPGVVMIDRAKIDAFNAVNPMITIATVPPFHRVDAQGMIATLKIIAYSVPDSAIKAAMQGVAGALRIARPAYRTASLIETQTGARAPTGKGRAALTARLDRFEMSLTPRCVVLHQIDTISQALRDAPGDVLFVLTASATSDPMDVGPQALRDAGGHVEAFGMPVDPGNLLFFGDLKGKPVIGLPGCARSPALNGADWVMERLICAVSVTQADIAALGVGGLLKEIPTRPQPRRSGE